LTSNEWLFVIAAITGITTVIQCIEMYLLVRTHRQTNAILENPGPMVADGIHGYLTELIEDPKMQEEFFSFVAICGKNMWQGVGATDAGDIKPVKLKGRMKMFEPIVNNPKIQEMVAQKIAATIQATGEAGISNATKKIADTWG